MRSTILLAAFLALEASAQPMSGVYPIGPGGPGVDSFPTIQAAAAALSYRGLAGDVDFPIQQFVYTGAVTLRNVAGSDRFLTRFYPEGIGAIVDAGGAQHGFAVESTDNVTVQGLRFRGCRSPGSAFVRFTASDHGTLRSCRLEDSAQFGVQVIRSDSFLAESLRYEGDLLGDDSRGLDFRDCRFAFATRCTMLGRVGNGLWIDGGSDNGNYRVTTMNPVNHGLHVENSPRVSIHNFVARGSSQFAGYVVNSPFARLESCVFAGAARTNAHFERCESLWFDMGMGIGDPERSVAVINSPYSEVMKLSVMLSPARGLYVYGSPECHIESTQYAGFLSDTCIGIEIDSSDCTMLTWTQMVGRVGRGLSIRRSSDVKVNHARFHLTVADAGVYLEQADRATFEPCSLDLAGAQAAVLVADGSASDSFGRMTITGTPRVGILANGARYMVVANSFITGWAEDGIRLDGSITTGLYYNSITGFAGATGSAVHLMDAADVDARDNILVTRGADSAACWRISGTWPFRPGSPDYNDLYIAGSGSTARYNDTLYRTLAEWRGLSWSPDSASIAADPMFAADTDYHILEGSPCRHAGVPVAGISYDIDTDERDPVSPDIGADEYVPPGVSEGPSGAVPRWAVLDCNPVSDAAELNYELTESATVRLRLYDVSGRTVLDLAVGRRSAGQHRTSLALSAISAGVYLLEVTAGARAAVVKLVRQ